jgi:hypothetical protein
VATAYTDATGRCAVSLGPRDEWVVASKAGVGSSGLHAADKLVKLRNADGESVITLVPPVIVQGVVLYPDERPAPECLVAFQAVSGDQPGGAPLGAPVGGASVVVARMPEDADEEVERIASAIGIVGQLVNTAEDGSFAVSLKETGDHLVSASHPGGHAWAEAVRVKIEGPVSRHDVALVLGTPAPLSGVVHDADGQPVPKALVELRLLAPAVLPSKGVFGVGGHIARRAAVFAMEGGRFVFSTLPQGLQVEVRACAPGTPTTACESPWIAATSGQRDLVLVVDAQAPRSRSASLHVTVRAAATGEPVPVVRWCAVREGDSDFQLLRRGESEEGLLVVADLDPDATYALWVTAKEHAGVSVPGLRPTLEGTPLVVELPLPGALAVEVLDAHGAPVPLAPVTLVSTFKPKLGGPQPWAQPTTDALGRALVEGLDPGRYRVTVSAHGKSAEVDADVPAGARGSIRITLGE